MLRAKQPLYAGFFPSTGFFATVFTVKHACKNKQFTHKAWKAEHILGIV